MDRLGFLASVQHTTLEELTQGVSKGLTETLGPRAQNLPQSRRESGIAAQALRPFDEDGQENATGQGESRKLPDLVIRETLMKPFDDRLFDDWLARFGNV